MSGPRQRKPTRPIPELDSLNTANQFDGVGDNFGEFLGMVYQVAHDSRMFLLMRTGRYTEQATLAQMKMFLQWFDMLANIERGADRMLDDWADTIAHETMETAEVQK